MKEFFKVLKRFVPPYRKYLVLSVAFTLLSAVLNVFSFMVLIPILQIFFKVTDPVEVDFIDAQEDDFYGLAVELLPSKIESLLQGGYSRKDIAVLVRTGREGNMVAEKLLESSPSETRLIFPVFLHPSNLTPLRYTIPHIPPKPCLTGLPFVAVRLMLP